MLITLQEKDVAESKLAAAEARAAESERKMRAATEEALAAVR